MTARENFYLLLELALDPPESDTRRIEAAIEAKMRECSRSATGLNESESKRILGLERQMREVMLDPAKRAEEASAGRALREQARQDSLRKLDSDLRILGSKGHLNAEDFEGLLKKYRNKQKNLSETEIRQRIKVPIRAAEPTATPSALQESTLREIARLLATTGKSDGKTYASLYDFLGLTPGSTCETLHQVATAKQTEFRQDKQHPREDHKQLAGHCLSLFDRKDVTEAKRQAYDRALAQASYAQLDELIDLAGLDGHIQAEEFESLLQTAAEKGLALDRTKEYILARSKAKRWTVTLPQHSTLERMERCGACGIYNAPGGKNCHDCGFPMSVSCPGCGRAAASSARSCGQCGFALADMPNALPALGLARDALAQDDFKQAEAHLRQAARYWPGHPQLGGLEQALGQRRAQLEDLLDSLDQTLRARRYYAARALLSELKKAAPTHAALSHQALVDKQIAAAEACLQQLAGCTTTAAKVQAFQAALLAADDCEAARQGLISHPPDAPAELRLSVSADRIGLSWQAPAGNEALRYRVLRKFHSPLLHGNDGEILTETAQLRYDDLSPPGGESCYYAVFSLRERSCSVRGAGAGPGVLLPEVAELSLVTLDGGLQLRWQLPARARGVEIWRSEGRAPARAGEGQLLAGASAEGLLDTGLVNDRLYGYRICVRYSLPSGETRTAGLTCSGMPVSPPQPLRGLKAERRGEAWQLSWPQPDQGALRLFWSERAPAVPEQQPMEIQALAQHGREVPLSDTGSTLWQAPSLPVVHLWPVTVRGNLAVKGQTLCLTNLMPVSRLRGESRADKVYLEWDWPADCQQVLILWHPTRPPAGPEDTGARREHCTRAYYEQHGACILPKVQSAWYSVHAMAALQDQTIFAAGASLHLQPTTRQKVSYRIQGGSGLARLFSQPPRLVLEADTDVTLPALVLVARAGRPPLRSGDGRQLCEIAAGTRLDARRPHQVPISAADLPARSYARLFFADEADHDAVQLLMPPEPQLQVR